MEKDLLRAEGYYRRASERGDPDAAKALKELRAAAAPKPDQPSKKGGFLGLLKKFTGK